MGGFDKIPRSVIQVGALKISKCTSLSVKNPFLPSGNKGYELLLNMNGNKKY